MRKNLKAYRDQCDVYGYECPPEQLGWAMPAYVAETDEIARKEAGAHIESLFNKFIASPTQYKLPPGYSSLASFKAVVEGKYKVRQSYLDCDTLIVHQGVVPNVQMSRALGVEHTWNERNRCWDPVTGVYGETNVEGVVLAGDGQGIGGAQAAAYRGELAGLFVASQADKLESAALKRLGAGARDAANRQLAIRPFLDELYRPSDEFLKPSDETLVCRCEEVSAGDIREFAALGALGPNQAKAYGRCGMGPCQGRVCGLVVSEVLADALNTSPSEVGYYRIRPPIKPVTLGEVASLDDSDGLAETGRML